jgi:hypothetical protein
MERAAAEPPEKHHQGDEKGAPVDFFTPIVPAHKLNPHFVNLCIPRFLGCAKNRD